MKRVGNDGIRKDSTSFIDSPSLSNYFKNCIDVLRKTIKTSRLVR